GSTRSGGLRLVSVSRSRCSAFKSRGQVLRARADETPLYEFFRVGIKGLHARNYGTNCNNLARLARYDDRLGTGRSGCSHFADSAVLVELDYYHREISAVPPRAQGFERIQLDFLGDE